MDKKSNEISGNPNKNIKNLQGLQIPVQNKPALNNNYNSNNNYNPHQKNIPILKDQKSKSSSNLSAKENNNSNANNSNNKDKKVLKNNFFLKPKNNSREGKDLSNNDISDISNNNLSDNNNKFSVVYSKKPEDKNLGYMEKQNNNSNNNMNKISEQNEPQYSENNDKSNDYFDPRDYCYNPNQDNEDLSSDNEMVNNIEKTKKQNFIGNTNLNNNTNNPENIQRPKIKPKSAPKENNFFESKQDTKLNKKQNLENRNKFAASLAEANKQKFKEKQALLQAQAETEALEQAQANNNNKNIIIQPNQIPLNANPNIIDSRKPSSQYTNNSNNIQNKSRITNHSEKSNNMQLQSVNRILSTEEKIDNIEKINECFEKLEIKKVEKESMDKIKKKLASVQKKLRVLQEKGIELNLDQSSLNEEDEEEKKKATDNKAKNNYNDYDEEEKNYVFHDSDNPILVEKENEDKLNKYIKEKLNFDNISKIKNLEKDKSQQQLQANKKPVIDTLEFVKKINDERRKYFSKSPDKSEVLNRSDSFRRSNSENKVSNNNKFHSDANSQNKYKILSEYMDNNTNSDNKQQEDKKRREADIKQFMERKKREKKNIELKLKEENKKVMENKIKQLLQLEKAINTKNEKLGSNNNNGNQINNNNYSKKNINNNSQNHSRYSNSANKVRNDYYIGTRKTNNLDDSSILDPDDFYYTVLESKNIIVTQSQNSNKPIAGSAKNSNNSPYKDTNFNYNYLNNRTSGDDFNKQNAISRLSDFTNNNNYTYDKKISNKLSQENFLKFINENEKNTLRSMSSSNNNIKDIKANIKNYFQNNNKNDNSKITTDSKLINSKSSNFNTHPMNKIENLFEDNLINSAVNPFKKRDHKGQQKCPEFDEKQGKESNSQLKIQVKENENKEEEVESENEKKLSENEKSEKSKVLNQSDIEKDSFLLQLDNLLSLFCNKLKSVYQKKYFYDFFNLMIEREQIKYCYDTLNNLCNITKRSTFEKIRNYANRVHIENIYSVFNNLTLFAKRRAITKIFQHFALFKDNHETENPESEEYTENEEKLKLRFFVEIINQSFLYVKKEALFRIYEFAKNFSLYNDLDLNEKNLNSKTNDKIIPTKSSNGESNEDSEYSEGKIQKYIEYFNSTFELLTRFARRDAFKSLKAFALSNPNKNNNHDQVNLSQRSNSSSNVNNSRREKIILNKKSQGAENSFSSFFNQNKANSYIAHSNNTSNYSIHPNSLDSPRIRKLQIKLAQKNMEKEWMDNIDEKYNLKDQNNNLENAFGNPLRNSEDFDDNQSKNINCSKLSIEDSGFKEPKKDERKLSSNIKANEHLNDSVNSNNKNSAYNPSSNKYSNVNYNDEINNNINDSEKKSDKNSQPNNRYAPGNNDATSKSSSKNIAKANDHTETNKKENLNEKDKNAKNQPDAFDAAGNLKLSPPDASNNLNKALKHNKSLSEEIDEEIPEDNFDMSHRKKNSLKDSSGKNIPTDIDISADRDGNSGIDWIYSISHSKSGSLKDNASLLKQINDPGLKSEESKPSNNKHINIIENASDSINSITKPPDSNKNNLNNKSVPSKKDDERKVTEEDYSNNYNDFENIEEDILIDEEPDLAKIIGEESTSNIGNNQSLGQSLLKSRNNNKNALTDEKEKLSKPEEPKKENNDNRFIYNNNEKEIDLENTNVPLNVIPGKETIDSKRDYIKSIESDDNDFFKIKNNNNQNILNLLDDKSSNNKSVNVLSFNSPDIGADNASNNLRDVPLNKDTINSDLALDMKPNKKNEIPENNKNLNFNNLAAKEPSTNNRRYDNVENSAKKPEQPSIDKDKEFLSFPEMESLSEELADKIINDLLLSEIKQNYKPLIPKKEFKNEASLLNMINSLNNSSTNKSSLGGLDNSTSSTITNNVFSKSILEQKKETSMKLYVDKIGPNLIDNIIKDISNSNIK